MGSKLAKEPKILIDIDDLNFIKPRPTQTNPKIIKTNADVGVRERRMLKYFLTEYAIGERAPLTFKILLKIIKQEEKTCMRKNYKYGTYVAINKQFV